MDNNLYVTDLKKLCGADQLVYTDGKAKGMTVIRMYNGCLNLMFSGKFVN